MTADPNNEAAFGQETTNLMTCVECGFRFEPPVGQMWLRCPGCGILGYPDRAKRNLLSLDWDCPSCGARNSGLVNFCTHCGVGLASRCIRCEAPVYTAICPHCGSHQERLLRFQKVEEHRASWTPILLTQLEESRQPFAETMDSWSLTKPEQRRLKRARRNLQAHTQQHKRSPVRIPGWGIIWVAVGLLMLAWQFRANLELVFSTFSQQIQITRLALAWDSVDAWWADFSLILNKTDSPEYSYLFASAVFGVAAIPIILYFLHRILRRLFP